MPADRAYYVQINAQGYGSAQQPVPAEDDRHIDLPPVVLKPAMLKVAGRVVDASETPLAGAWINVNGGGQPKFVRYFRKTLTNKFFSVILSNERK